MIKNVFICLTPLHFYIASTIAKEKYQSGHEHSYILFKGRFKYPRIKKREYLKIKIVNNGNYVSKICNYLYYKLFFSATKLGRLLHKGIKTLYVFNENDPITKNALCSVDSDTNVVLLEEGIGTWKSNVLGNSPHINEAFVGFPKEFLNHHPAFQGKVNFLEYNTIFNIKTAASFFDIIGVNNNSVCKGKVIFYLGQITTNYSYTDEQDIESLNNIFSSFPNYNFIIKPHPRENWGKYDGILTNNVTKLQVQCLSLPMEALCYNYNINAVISPLSSSACYLGLINPQIKVVFLCKLKNSPYNSLKSDDVYEQFHNIKNFYFPQTISELGNILAQKVVDNE